jgi:uncharacterized protein
MSWFRRLFGQRKNDSESHSPEETFEQLCEGGSVTEIQKAIRAGADVNKRSMHGGTPLMSAVKNPNAGVIALLVAAGANVNAQSTKGQTALMIAAMDNTNPKVIIELINAGADVNAQNHYGWTALLWAAQENTNPEVITALINGGADVGLPNLLSVCESNRNKEAILEVLKLAITK